MDLPKLYRKVQLRFEWCVDSLQGGEHHQDYGYNYLQAMRVLDAKGNWFWHISYWRDLEEEKEYFDKYNHHEENGWCTTDENEENFIYDYKHDPSFSYNRLTIKERKEREKPTEVSDKTTRWCSDIPF